jgi:limonene-1,2-epoxide hydrolase
LFHKKTGRDFPATGKGQLACTIKRLSASFSADDLDGAIRSWFTQDRRDYGVGLFKMKLEGGDRELLKRGQTFQDDPQALRNGVALAAMAEKSK